MKKHFKILNLLLLLYYVVPVYGQKQDVHLENYNIEDGLSLSHINCLIQDKKGYIWIGTQDGLNKYDGYSFKVYRHKPVDSTSISSNNIQSICEDEKGDLWIATQYGLNEYCRNHDNFERIINIDYNNATLSDNNIYNVYQDKKGNLWLKNLNGIDKLNIEQNKFTHHEHFYDLFNFPTHYNNFSILEDSYSKLWVATKDGLNYFDQKNELFRKYSFDDKIIKSISDNEIRVLYEDSKKTFFIGTSKGLNIYDRKNDCFKRIYVPYSSNKLANLINSIQEDKNGTIWIGTGAGLYIFNKEFRIFFNITDLYNGVEELMHEHISSLLIDNSNILWIGTRGGGLYKLNFVKRKFNLYRKTNSGYLDLSSNEISSIFVKNDEIWLGTRNSGLNIYNKRSGDVLHFNEKTETYSVPDNYVQSIFEDKNGQIWIGTANGVSICNPATKSFKPFKNICLSYKNAFKNNRVYKIIQDHNSTIWFGTQHGLFAYKNRKLKKYRYNSSDSTTISANEVYTMLEDTDSTLWVGTVGGLNKFDPEKKIFKRYIRKINSPIGISNNSILSLYEDKNNMIWIGTESGLNKFDKEKETFQYYTQEEGFISDYIYSIIGDKYQNLWVSTNIGISRFNPKTKKVTNFDLSDGLQWYEFNLGAHFQSKDGEIFFGGNKGFNSFFVDSIKRNNYIPKVVITNIKKTDSEGVHEIFNENKSTYNIFYKDFNLTISFAVLEFSESKKNEYKYMLEGFEDNWISLQNQNSVTFSQLPPGRYTFKIMGANSDLVWNKESTDIKIIVRPSIFNSTYSYILYLILGITLIYLFILYITRNLRRDNNSLKEKERAAKRIAKQKEELSIINKNILDSMKYAQRIIKAMMPSEKFFKKIIPQSFVLYKPKEIVSGDFYWITQKENKIFIAAVDCTGHGIPGAFMSIIGFDLLRSIINVQNIENPSDILKALSIGIVETFGVNEEEGVYDGMDMAFCTFDTQTKILNYAGAYNPLYVIRNDSLIEYKADRFSVGIYGSSPDKKYKNNVIKMQENDVIYMFSDGYTDQFGGPNEKKYKFRKFRHLLLSIHYLPMEEQKESINQSNETWKGDLEQIDDILVIGAKLYNVGNQD